MSPLNADRELVTAFLQDADSFLSGADAHFAALDANPSDEEAVRELFRITHSLKGNAGYMGLDRMKELSHTLENLLLQLRDKPGSYTPQSGKALRAGVDELKAISARIKEGREELEDEPAYAAILSALDQVADQIKISDVSGLWAGLTADFNSFLEKFQSEDPVLADLLSKMMFAVGALDPYLKGEKKQEHHAAEAAPRQEQKQEAAAPAGPAVPANMKALAALCAEFEKVQADLDRAVDAAPKLSSQDPALYVELRAALETNAVLLSKFRKELGGGEVPLSRLLGRIPLIVADVASKSGKKARAEVSCEPAEIALPRRVYELLESPIVHLVRNAVDHGIEEPGKRAPKPEEGAVKVSARAGEGLLEIAISDDGRGIDASAVKWKAVAKGMLDAERAGTITDEEVYQLLFLPGFSTAEVVTDISGRGVGMDVVKNNVEAQLGGKILIASQAGKGSTFTLALALETSN